MDTGTGAFIRPWKEFGAVKLTVFRRTSPEFCWILATTQTQKDTCDNGAVCVLTPFPPFRQNTQKENKLKDKNREEMAEARSEEEEENMRRDTGEQVVRRPPSGSGGKNIVVG